MADISSDIHIHRIRKFEPIKSLINKFELIKKKLVNEPTPPPMVKSKQPTLPPLAYPLTPPKTAAGKIRMLLSDLFENPDPMVFWGVFAFLKGFLILMRKDINYRLIFSTSPPHSTQVFGCLLSKIFKLPHIMDLRDPWTDIYRGYKSPFRMRFESALESFAVHSSAYVISSTESYSNLLRHRYPEVPKDRFLTITNSFEEEKFASIKEIPSDRFVIAYLGIFYPMRNPYCFFVALKQWLDEYPDKRKDVEFRIIGDSDPTTKNMVISLGLSDIVAVTGRVPHEEAIHLTNNSDLLLIATGTGAATPRGWIPSKLFEYLACRKPILANIPVGDASEIIRKTNSGYVVSNDDVNEIESILELEYFRKYHPGNPGLKFDPDEEKIAQYSNGAVIRQFARAFDNALK
jgi:glycosyltransferase involved in cell wall biosynthesis